MTSLESATRKLRQAEAGVTRAQERAAKLVADARAEVDTARAELADAIRAADAAGVRQRDIVEQTGYSRERVRQIVADQ